MFTKEIVFTKVKDQHGWLGNMSAHPIFYDNKEWRTAEALFQASRFDDESIKELIRSQKSPMMAKFKAKEHKDAFTITPCGMVDCSNMSVILALKINQHSQLKTLLLDTGDKRIIEDCTKRKPSFWGAQFVNGTWQGTNKLGELWMQLRDSLKGTTEMIIDNHQNEPTNHTLAEAVEKLFWEEISKNVKITRPIKKVIFTKGTVITIILTFKESSVASAVATEHFDLNDSNCINNGRNWFNEVIKINTVI